MKKNNVLKTCLLLAAWPCLVVQAQYQLNGTIRNKAGETLPFAAVSVKESQLSTLSDAEGNYVLKGLRTGKYVLQVRCLGHTNINDTIVVEGNLLLDLSMQTSNQNLDEVVVSATRVNENSGFAYSNLDAESIKKKNIGQDAPYLLNQLTGVVVNSDAGNAIGYTGLRIRGSDATRINVTINGVPVNDAESQGTFFVNMPDLASSINNIQVQRGVGASSNGAGAFGASINFQTNLIDEKPYANVITGAGSYNSFRTTLAAGTGLLNNHLVVDARASLIKSEGYVDRASSDLKSYYLSAAWLGKKTVVKFINFYGKEKTYQAWYYVPEDSIKSGNRTYNPAGAYYDENGLLKFYNNETDNYQQNNFQFHVVHQLSKRLNFNVTAHYTKGSGYYEQYKNPEMENLSGGSSANFSAYGLADVVVGNDTITQTNLIRQLWLNNDFAGGIFNLQYRANQRIDFTLGGGYNSYFGKHYGEIVWMEYASTSEKGYQYYYNTANKNDGNLYLKTNFRPLSSLNVFVDLQLRNVAYRFLGYADDTGNESMQDQTYTFFNPKLGFSYNLSQRFNMYGSIAIANKEPNRNDFVQSSPTSRPMPESMTDVEFGANFKMKNFSIAANVYNMAYKNQLVLNGQVNDVGAYNRVNVDKSYRRGLEIEATAIFSKYIAFSANLALSINKIAEYEEFVDSANADYSIYVQTKTKYKNTDISFSPNSVAGVAFVITPVKQLEITLSGKQVGRQFLDNTQNTNKSINPYATLDVTINYAIKTKFIPDIMFQLALYNVTSAAYSTNGYTYSYYYDSDKPSTFNYFAPSAPFNFLAGINLKF